MPRKKTYRFYYHLNKPETMKQGCVVWSIHWKKQCFQATHLEIKTPTFTREQTKRQPYAVVVGDAIDIAVDSSGTAIIK